MDKKAVVYIHNGIKKNTFESVLMRWMKLEPIIQSEVSQKEKLQYSKLMHIYGIQKDGNDNPVCETAKETQMYRTVFWTLWQRKKTELLSDQTKDKLPSLQALTILPKDITIYGIQKDGTDNPVCETAKETQIYRTDFQTLWERERVG